MSEALINNQNRGRGRKMEDQASDEELKGEV